MTYTRASFLVLFFGMAPIDAICGAIVYSTGFENPPLIAGSQLLGQDGWSTAIPPFLNPSAATITSSLAASGTQSVVVLGSSLQSSGGITAPYDAVGSYRRPVNFDAAAAGQPLVRVRAVVRLDGPVSPAGTNFDYVAASVAARGVEGALGELELTSDGRVYAYTGNAVADRSQSLFSAPITLGAWHTLTIDIDFLTNFYAFSVDGMLLGQTPFEPGFVADTLVRGSIVTYGGPILRDAYAFRFDDFEISAQATPEPTSLALFGIAAVVLGMRRVGWRRR